MNKVYKGYELMEEIAKGNIKDGTEFIEYNGSNECTKSIYVNGELRHRDEKFGYDTLWHLKKCTFKPIEDQTIDIEECNINISCQELDHNLRDIQSYINNVIVEELKHLNKEIQSIKERK